MNKKRLIIILIVVLVGGVLLTILAVLPGKRILNLASDNLNNQPNLFVPEFSTDIDKEQLGLPLETKVQILERGVNGGIMVYKVIDNDQDVITDPSSIIPLGPRAEVNN